jgi:transposase-like protein
MALHNTSMMQCPKCKSTHLVKNGWRNNQQNYLCRNCGRQLRDPYASKGYAQEVKQHCLTLYVNGVGFRGIERATGVNHNTVINGVKKAQHLSPDENHEIPQTAQVDELQTFVGSKKPKSGLGWHSTRNPLE